MSAVNYSPPYTVRGFLKSEAFISLIMGPVGSTKTTAAIMKIAYHAKRMAACTDGIRRSRAVWVRNTREQLRDTSIPDFLKWYPDGEAGRFHKTDGKFLLKFDDVECEVLFRALEDSNDVRKLLSLQASFAIFEEFRELTPQIFEAMQGRLGRYPDGMMVPHRAEWGLDEKNNPIMGCVTDEGKPNKHIWGASNPPVLDTYWAEFIQNPPSNADVFCQPSGLSPEADWIHYLPSMYYEDLAVGKDEDYINVYIHGRFGQSLAGKPVHRSFNSDWHIAKSPLRALHFDNNPLLIGHDFGLNPSATIGQLTANGRLMILADATSDGMGTLQFVRTKLKPMLATRFPGLRNLVIGDPAGVQRAQTDEKSVFDILKQEGFSVVSARTNSIVARIAAVDGFLNGTVDGQPRFLVDPSCTHIIKALRGGYRYKLKRNGELEDSPEKNIHSHIADSLQYLCLHADGGRMFGVNQQTQRREVRQVASTGWV